MRTFCCDIGKRVFRIWQKAENKGRNGAVYAKKQRGNLTWREQNAAEKMAFRKVCK